MAFVSSSEKSLIELSSEDESASCSLRASSVAYFLTKSVVHKRKRKEKKKKVDTLAR